MKLNKCVAFGITANMTFAVANVILAIEYYSPNVIDKYLIFYDKNDPINENEINVLKKISKNIEFKEFTFSGVKISKDILNRYSKLVFCKLEIFKLLQTYAKVLWLDADILIQGNIAEIFEYKPIAWRRTINDFNLDFPELDGIQVDSGFTAPNGGVILVTDDLKNYEFLYKECYEILRKISGENYILGLDELVFGILNFKYKLNAVMLPKKYNSGTAWKDSQDAIIVHSIGEKKFWNDALRYIVFSQWRVFNNVYLRLGGKNGVKTLKHENLFGREAKSLFNAFNNYEYWNSIVENINHNLLVIKPSSLFKSFVKVYIRDIPTSIYYKLTKCANGAVKVELNFEGFSRAALYDNKNMISHIYKISELLDCDFDNNDNIISIYKITNKKQCVSVLKKFIANTINYLVLNFSYNLTTQKMFVYIMKNYYRYGKSLLNNMRNKWK